LGYELNGDVTPTIRCLLRYAHIPMQLTIHIPDDLFDDVKDKLAAQPSGILETIALDAILGFWTGLETMARPAKEPDEWVNVR
jgi:hypothetical protein